MDYTAPQITNQMPQPTPPGAGQLMVSYGKVTLDVSVAASDLAGLCILPKRCMPVDLKVISDVLDSGATIAGIIGIANASLDDLESSMSLMTATTALRAGGTMATPLEVGYKSIAVSDVDRVVALKISAAASASSSSAAAGSVYGWLTYRAYDAREY